MNACSQIVFKWKIDYVDVDEAITIQNTAHSLRLAVFLPTQYNACLSSNPCFVWCLRQCAARFFLICFSPHPKWKAAWKIRTRRRHPSTWYEIFETMALIRDDRVTKSLFCSAEFRDAIFFLAVEFFSVGVLASWRDSVQCAWCYHASVRQHSLKIPFRNVRKRVWKPLIVFPLRAWLKFYGQWFKAK